MVWRAAAGYDRHRDGRGEERTERGYLGETKQGTTNESENVNTHLISKCSAETVNLFSGLCFPVHTNKVIHIHPSVCFPSITKHFSLFCIVVVTRGDASSYMITGVEILGYFFRSFFGRGGWMEIGCLLAGNKRCVCMCSCAHVPQVKISKNSQRFWNMSPSQYNFIKYFINL